MKPPKFLRCIYALRIVYHLPHVVDILYSQAGGWGINTTLIFSSFRIVAIFGSIRESLPKVVRVFRVTEDLPTIRNDFAINLGGFPQSVSSMITVIADIAEIAWEDLAEDTCFRGKVCRT